MTTNPLPAPNSRHSFCYEPVPEIRWSLASCKLGCAPAVADGERSP